MAEQFVLSPLEVKEALRKIQKKIDEITKLRDNLNIALQRYKANFKDEIVDKTSAMIKKIDSEIESLNRSFVDYTKKLQEIMTEIQDWRSI